MAKIIRVHGASYTVDQAVIGKSPKAAQTEAYYIMREGCWIDNTLHPPSTIVKIEVIEK